MTEMYRLQETIGPNIPKKRLVLLKFIFFLGGERENVITIIVWNWRIKRTLRTKS
jgi:hypothetical protein